jgi:hypothetical protein
MPENANAFPRKHFFLEMFTRDISLEDCILDLIDNSIDALVKTKNIDVSSDVFRRNTARLVAKDLPSVDVTLSEKQLVIKDNCGGISYDDAKNDVFNFGHGADPVKGQLGAYGIGLKRAIFKIGNDFLMESHAKRDGFSCHLSDVRRWSERDEKLEDWTIPIKLLPAAESTKDAGTSIVIRDLRAEVKMRLNDGTVEGRLLTLIAQTYSLYLDRYIRVSLNGKAVRPFEIPIGESPDVTPAHDEFEDGKVQVKIFASLSAKSQAETAGWYVLCNGRVVVHADKTELTGWGVGSPQFHGGKHVHFIGLVFFQAKDPLLLPWTTTKRGLNRESPVYHRAKNRMSGVASPILRFLDGMYRSDPPAEPKERGIADKIKPADVRQIAAHGTSHFAVKMPASSAQPKTVRIQYDALVPELERIRRHLRKPSMPANRVGEQTFKHFLKTECPD